jgi:hypothetical protein
MGPLCPVHVRVPPRERVHVEPRVRKQAVTRAGGLFLKLSVCVLASQL